MKQTVKVVALIMTILTGIISVDVLAQADTANGLSMGQAIGQALEHSSTIRQAEISLEIAQLQLENAQATSYIPRISLNVIPPTLSKDGLEGEITGTVGAQLSLPLGTASNIAGNMGLALSLDEKELDIPSWKLSFSQDLDLSQTATAASDLEAKRQALTEAQLKWEKARDDVVVAVIEQFGGLLSEKMAKQQAQASLETSEKNQSDVQARFDDGRASRSELLEAQLSLLNAQIKLEQVKQQYTTDKDAFQREMLGESEDFDPLSLDLPVDKLQSQSSKLILQNAIPDEAISSTSSVRNAEQEVDSAREQLRSARLDALPAISLQASIDQQGWKIGLSASFDLFVPNRMIDISIAEAQLKLAKQRLAEARHSAENNIRNKHSLLQQALNNVEQISLQEQKWQLEKTMNESKLEAGLLSNSDWESFLADKDAFYQTVLETRLSLLVAYFNYCSSIGMNAKWEDWL